MVSPSTILTTFASKVVEFPQDATGNTTIMMGKSNFVKKKHHFTLIC
uniref:Uncharacterized protein n=1 Tax=Salmonella enteritidis TaxID=149539 RepID=A0A1B0QZ03_SALEN|nr:hypothetical protein pSEN110055_149 [Salmonella enterica subsp. enterica serovar Enteritidis]